VTGRSLHDALLRVLTSARLRGLALAGDVAALGAEVGHAEAAALCATDPARLGGLARFMGRHFFRERIVRLFAAGRRVARESGRDPLRVLEGPAFGAFLDSAELGSTGSAETVARLVEDELAPVLGAVGWGPALLAYEGALFRAEAGPRRWGTARTGTIAVRAAGARVLTLAWDVTPLVAAVRRGEATLPAPGAGPARLLIALGADGRVSAARCSDGLARLLDALAEPQPPAALAAALGVPEADLRGALEGLAGIGAVEWRAAAAAPAGDSGPAAAARELR
jgi:hypothetical protein